METLIRLNFEGQLLISFHSYLHTLSISLYVIYHSRVLKGQASATNPSYTVKTILYYPYFLE